MVGMARSRRLADAMPLLIVQSRSLLVGEGIDKAMALAMRQIVLDDPAGKEGEKAGEAGKLLPGDAAAGLRPSPARGRGAGGERRSV